MEIRRNGFFTGKLLTADDLSGSQDYSVPGRSGLLVKSFLASDRLTQSDRALAGRFLGSQSSILKVKRVAAEHRPESTLAGQLKNKQQELVELRKQIVAKTGEIHRKVAEAQPQPMKAEDPDILDSVLNFVERVKDIFFEDSDEKATLPPDLAEDMRQLEELRQREQEVQREIRELIQKIEQIQSATQQDFKSNADIVRSTPFSGATAENIAATNIHEQVDLQLQFEPLKLSTQRLARIQS